MGSTLGIASITFDEYDVKLNVLPGLPEELLLQLRNIGPEPFSIAETDLELTPGEPLRVIRNLGRCYLRFINI